MSWEAPPEPGRRWTVAAGVVAVVLAVTVAAVMVRPGAVPSELAVDAADGAVGTDLDGDGAADGLRRAPLEPAATPSGGAPEGGMPELTVVIADFGSRVQLVELATGAQRTVPVFVDGTRQRPDALQIVGDSIVLDAAGRVIRLVEGDEGAPQQLARNHRSIPTEDATSVWVFDQLAANIGGVATRVGFDGTVADRIELPALARPLAGTAEGLVIRTPGTVSLIDSDGDRHLVARGQALASDGTHLARLDCLGDLSCGIVVGTLDQPDQARVTLQPGDIPVGLFDEPQAAFAPGGGYLALPVYREVGNNRIDRSSIVVIDTALGTVVDRVPGSTLTAPTTPFAWSPDGTWLAVSSGTRLLLWNDDHGARELALRLPPTYAVAVR